MAADLCRGVILALVAAVVALASWAPAGAHGIGHRMLDQRLESGGVALGFRYTTGEPVAYAPYKLFNPDEIEFQNGRTDRLGRVMFLPDQTGTWRLEVSGPDDHDAVATVEVGEDQTVPPETPWHQWIVQGSVLGNVVLLAALAGVLATRRRGAGEHGQRQAGRV